MASHSFPIEKVIKLEILNDPQRCNIGFAADPPLTKNLLVKNVPAAAASAITAFGVSPESSPPFVYVEYQIVDTSSSFDAANYSGRFEIREFR
jgi:hypothetical protein